MNRRRRHERFWGLADMAGQLLRLDMGADAQTVAFIAANAGTERRRDARDKPAHDVRGQFSVGGLGIAGSVRLRGGREGGPEIPYAYALALITMVAAATTANAACLPPVNDCCENSDTTWTCWVECTTDDGITICEEITIDFGTVENSWEFGLKASGPMSVGTLRRSGGKIVSQRGIEVKK